MTDEQTKPAKARKERSPSFPFIPLKKAVERLKEMADAHRRSPTRMIVAGQTWGYAPKSSGLLQTVAALKAFGLVDDLGGGADRKIQISELGWRILQDARPGAKDTAIRDAALKPRLIAEYANQWLPERPSASHCLSELHLDRGFNEDAAKLFLKVFDDTVDYANLREGDKVSPNFEGEIDPMPTASHSHAELQGVAAVGLVGEMKGPQPQAPHPVPFQMHFGPGKLSGTFNLTSSEQADEMIKAINAMKLLLRQPGEGS